MPEIAVLTLRDSNFEQEYAVRLELIGRHEGTFEGRLPGAEQIFEEFQTWQEAYDRLGPSKNRTWCDIAKFRRNDDDSYEACRQALQKLEGSLAEWYNAPGFTPIKDQLLSRLHIAGKSGVVGIHLPDSLAPLEEGKKYSWLFSYLCTERSGYPAVYGAVQRTALDWSVAKKLEVVSSREQVVLYAEQGLWYNTLSGLVRLQCSEPKSTWKADWAELLRSKDIELDELVLQPLLSDGASTSK